YYNRLGYEAYLRKQREKEEEDNALFKLQEQLSSSLKPSDLDEALPSKKKKEKKDTSFLGDLGSVAKNVAKSSLGNPLQFPQRLMEQTAKSMQEKSRKPDPITSELARGSNRALDASTFGLFRDKVDPMFMDQREGAGAAADIGYSLLGSLAPGAGIVGGLRGLGMGAKVAPGMSSLGKAG